MHAAGVQPLFARAGHSHMISIIKCKEERSEGLSFVRIGEVVRSYNAAARCAISSLLSVAAELNANLPSLISPLSV